MNTIDYLESVKRKLSLPSDYALAKVLGLTRGAVSAFQLGKASLGDETAVKVAEILNVPAGKILVDMHMERSKAPEVKAAWAALMASVAKSFDFLMPRSTPRLRGVVA
ncbi:helix-turn-helix domain-containing protein [Herbaspirillum huttiense]|uniref:helix-turn-helix domain-containing protein n=1 Tax=Herbaspirillum huttiense TaxID=863372 RepID=UPI0031E456D1